MIILYLVLTFLCVQSLPLVESYVFPDDGLCPGVLSHSTTNKRFEYSLGLNPTSHSFSGNSLSLELLYFPFQKSDSTISSHSTPSSPVNDFDFQLIFNTNSSTLTFIDSSGSYSISKNVSAWFKIRVEVDTISTKLIINDQVEVIHQTSGLPNNLLKVAITSNSGRSVAGKAYLEYVKVYHDNVVVLQQDFNNHSEIFNTGYGHLIPCGNPIVITHVSDPVPTTGGDITIFGNFFDVIGVGINSVVIGHALVCSGAHIALLEDRNSAVLKCRAPQGTGTKMNIRVTLSDQRTSPVNEFFSYQPPYILSASQPPTTGGICTIVGMNFGNNLTNVHVTVGHIPCNIVNFANDQLTCDMPSGAGGQKHISILVNSSAGGRPLTNSNQNVTFSYLSPEVLGISDSVPTTGGVLTILGNNFGDYHPLISVTVGEYSCNVLSANHTKLVCLLDEGTGAGHSVQVIARSNTATGVPLTSQDSSVLFSYQAPHVISSDAALPLERTTIYGRNFGSNPAKVVITIGSTSCTQIYVSPSHDSMSCVISPSADAVGENIHISVVVDGLSNNADNNAAFSFDVMQNPLNGHFYQYIPSIVTWVEAVADISSRRYKGLQGYLAIISSVEEQTFLSSAYGNRIGWLGMSYDNINASSSFVNLCATASTSLYANATSLSASGCWDLSPIQTTSLGFYIEFGGCGDGICDNQFESCVTCPEDCDCKMNGLVMEYFNNKNLLGVPSKVDLVDGVHTSFSPVDREYSIRWSGRLVSAQSGTYGFNIKTDGGVRLWVAGQLIVDAWTVVHEYFPEDGFTSKVQLFGSQMADLRLDYFFVGNPPSEGVKLQWFNCNDSSSVSEIPLRNLVISHYCMNGFCESGETVFNCPFDCGVCGDGMCGVSEDRVGCPQDCAVCGDGYCDVAEDASCNKDCYAVCGDNRCDMTETVTSCPQDCVVCGDGVCVKEKENWLSCPQDCTVCGNKQCDAPHENRTNCPLDCAVCGDGECDIAGGEDSITCLVDCSSICGNGVCERGEDCPRDCHRCGDGLCEAGERCDEDCDYCGNDYCGSFETLDSCPRDCTLCGDGICSKGESRLNCPEDCSIYLDGFCDPTENFWTHPLDCGCGNGNCNRSNGENAFNCPEDCSVCGDGICGTRLNHVEFQETCAVDCITSSGLRKRAGACGDGICDFDERAVPLGQQGSCFQDCAGRVEFSACEDITPDKEFLLPGLQQLNRGFDILTGRGTTPPLFHFSFCKGKTFDNVHRNIKFAIPDQIHAAPQPQCEYSASTQFYSSVQDIAHTMAKNSGFDIAVGAGVGADAGLWKVSAEVNAAYSKDRKVNIATKEKSQNDITFAETTADCFTTSVTLESSSIQLHPDFARELNDINSIADGVALLQKYGAYYYRSANMGGRLQQFTFIKKDFFSSSSSSRIEEATKSSFGVKVSGSSKVFSGNLNVSTSSSGSTATGSEAMKQLEQNSKSTDVLTIGGAPGAYGPDAGSSTWSTWAESTDLLPVPIEYQLGSLLEIIPDVVNRHGQNIHGLLLDSAKVLFENNPLIEPGSPEPITQTMAPKPSNLTLIVDTASAGLDFCELPLILYIDGSNGKYSWPLRACFEPNTLRYLTVELMYYIGDITSIRIDTKATTSGWDLVSVSITDLSVGRRSAFDGHLVRSQNPTAPLTANTQIGGDPNFVQKPGPTGVNYYGIYIISKKPAVTPFKLWSFGALDIQLIGERSTMSISFNNYYSFKRDGPLSQDVEIFQPTPENKVDPRPLCNAGLLQPDIFYRCSFGGTEVAIVDPQKHQNLGGLRAIKIFRMYQPSSFPYISNLNWEIAHVQVIDYGNGRVYSADLGKDGTTLKANTEINIPVRIGD